MLADFRNPSQEKLESCYSVNTAIQYIMAFMAVKIHTFQVKTVIFSHFMFKTYIVGTIKTKTVRTPSV